MCEHFIKAYKKHINFNYKMFIGTNKRLKNSNLLKATPLAVNKSNWRNETLQQLKLLKKKNPEIKKILVFLDDFIITEFFNDRGFEYYIEEVFKKI